MTTPAGSPIWARSSAASTYGGGANKRNYGGIGAVNANTDVTAEQYMRLCADVAAIGQTSYLAMMEIYNDAGTFYVNFVSSAWATAYSTQYLGTSPPSALYPTVTAVSGTVCEVTLPATPADEYGVTGAVSVRAVDTFGDAYWTKTATANVFRISNLINTATCSLTVY